MNAEQINESLPPGYTVLKRDVPGVAVPEGTTVMLSEGTSAPCPVVSRPRRAFEDGPVASNSNIRAQMFR